MNNQPIESENTRKMHAAKNKAARHKLVVCIMLVLGTGAYFYQTRQTDQVADLSTESTLIDVSESEVVPFVDEGVDVNADFSPEPGEGEASEGDTTGVSYSGGSIGDANGVEGESDTSDLESPTYIETTEESPASTTPSSLDI